MSEGIVSEKAIFDDEGIFDERASMRRLGLAIVLLCASSTAFVIGAVAVRYLLR